MPSRFAKGAAGAGLGVGLAGVAAARVIRFRRRSARGYDLSEAPAPGTGEFARLVEAMTGAPVRQGNRIRFMRNGDETFPAMLEAIASAERTVDFSSYIYWTSTTADDFADALIERARAGVEVNFLLDGWGSAKLDRDLVDRVEREGVNVAWFRRPRWYTLRGVNNRMHRRVLVVDGRIGFAGGVGIAEQWTGNAEDPDHWRETHVRIEGPVVRDLFGAFLENWTEATHGVLTGAHVPEIPGFDDGVPMQLTKSSSSDADTAAEQLFYAAIAGARRRLLVTTAYFVPQRAFVDALCAAAERGVDVQVLVNGNLIDKPIVREAGQRSYSRLLESGVRIFEYKKAMLHAKVLVVDDAWANVGTSNLDIRSLSMNEELNLAVESRGVVAELENHFLQDLEESEEIDLERWQQRPLRKRISEYAGEVARSSL